MSSSLSHSPGAILDELTSDERARREERASTQDAELQSSGERGVGADRAAEPHLETAGPHRPDRVLPVRPPLLQQERRSLVAIPRADLHERGRAVRRAHEQGGRAEAQRLVHLDARLPAACELPEGDARGDPLEVPRRMSCRLEADENERLAERERSRRGPGPLRRPCCGIPGRERLPLDEVDRRVRAEEGAPHAGQDHDEEAAVQEGRPRHPERAVSPDPGAACTGWRRRALEVALVRRGAEVPRLEGCSPEPHDPAPLVEEHHGERRGDPEQQQRKPAALKDAIERERARHA